MSRVSDHIRRDAEHAARAEISILLSKYQRRLYEEAKAHISTAIAEARAGELLDGTDVGREAVRTATTSYLGAATVQPAIDAAAAGGETATDS